MTKQIELTQGKFTTVDDEDFEYLSQWKWYATKNSKTWYAYRGKNIAMHREIVSCPQDMIIDHKDRDGLNNTKTNLRVCHKSDNTKNTSPFSKSGYKGVAFNGSSYVAHINGRHLGSFGSPEDAAKAYDIAAQEEFGEFAYLNNVC
jgi:hypothetical protein